MVQVTLEHAEAHLSDLIDQVRAGEEVEILRNGEAVARVINPSVSNPSTAALDSPPRLTPRVPGLLAGSILYISDDFDAPLEEMTEYMW